MQYRVQFLDGLDNVIRERQAHARSAGTAFLRGASTPWPPHAIRVRVLELKSSIGLAGLTAVRITASMSWPAGNFRARTSEQRNEREGNKEGRIWRLRSGLGVRSVGYEPRLARFDRGYAIDLAQLVYQLCDGSTASQFENDRHRPLRRHG
jgi:hypothetical protein